MQTLCNALSKAGVSSFELQAKVKAPASELMRFLSLGWPPYDQDNGLIAFARVGAEKNPYKATLLLSPPRKQGGDHRLVLEIRPETPSKIDLPFERIDGLLGFFRQRKKGFSFEEVRGVVHTMHSAPKAGKSFPLPFNKNMQLVGIRLSVKKKVASRFLLEDAIIEAVGGQIHRRLATRVLAVPRNMRLVGIARRILSCLRQLRSAVEGR